MVQHNVRSARYIAVKQGKLQDQLNSYLILFTSRFAYRSRNSGFSNRNYFWSEYDYLTRCHKCFTTAIIVHHYTRKHSIENATKMLKEMGIADEVCFRIPYIYFLIIIA